MQTPPRVLEGFIRLRHFTDIPLLRCPVRLFPLAAWHGRAEAFAWYPCIRGDMQVRECNCTLAVRIVLEGLLVLRCAGILVVTEKR